MIIKDLILDEYQEQEKCFIIMVIQENIVKHYNITNAYKNHNKIVIYIFIF